MFSSVSSNVNLTDFKKGNLPLSAPKQCSDLDLGTFNTKLKLNCSLFKSNPRGFSCTGMKLLTGMEAESKKDVL